MSLTNITIGVIVLGAMAGGGYLYGTMAERIRWREATLTQAAEFNQAVAEAVRERGILADQVKASKAARDALLEQLNHEALNDPGPLCLSPERVLELERAINELSR